MSDAKPPPVPSSSGIVPAAAPVTAPTSSSSNSSSASSRRQNNRRGNNNNNRPPQHSKWSGASSDLRDEDVFVLKDEFGPARNTRFMETLARLQVFAATKFPKSIRAMSSLFLDAPVNPKVGDPVEPQGADRNDRLSIALYMEERKRAVDERIALDNALHSFFTIIWGQSSPGIQNKIQGDNDFLSKKEDSDCAWLLDEIRQLMFNFTSSSYPPHSVYLAKRALFNLRQGKNLTLIEYKHRFDELVSVIEYYISGKIQASKGSSSTVWNTPAKISITWHGFRIQSFL